MPGQNLIILLDMEKIAKVIILVLIVGLLFAWVSNRDKVNSFDVVQSAAVTPVDQEEIFDDEVEPGDKDEQDKEEGDENKGEEVLSEE